MRASGKNLATRKRVVIALDLAKPDGRRKLAGIMSYLAAHRLHWDLRIKRGRDEFTEGGVADFPNWGIDGVIYSLPTATPEAAACADALARLDIPLVVIDPADHPAFLRRTRRMAVVKADTESIGQIAADHFLAQGRCRAYAYVPALLGRSWSRRRGQSFADALKRKGTDCRIFPSTRGQDDFTRLRAWLSALPKPAGILVAYDSRAMTVIEACAAEGLRIPRDVSILSVDDDAFLCESCAPTLSSILPAHEESGRRAAALLADLMDGRKPETRTVELPVESIVPRDSTLPESSAGHLVQKALAYIRANATRGVTVTDVVRHMRVSRTLADLRVRQVLDTSIGDLLESTRLDAVRKALLETSDTIKEIAERCGYRDPFHLMRVFKRRYGLTMGDFRVARRSSS